VIVKSKKFLSDQPLARIISISQNDNGNCAIPVISCIYIIKATSTLLALQRTAECRAPTDCKDPEELTVIKEEGSPMGPLLRAVNQVAKALAAEFPLVAVDTLACEPLPRMTYVSMKCNSSALCLYTELSACLISAESLKGVGTLQINTRSPHRPSQSQNPTYDSPSYRIHLTRRPNFGVVID
jgi:hypothetical protein